MSRSMARGVKIVGIILAWILGSAILFVAVAVFAFILTMKVETRSKQVHVPDLAAMSLEDADRAAGPLDLVVEVVDRRHDAQVASGRVLQQDPPAGASVKRGRKVRVVLSLGGQVLKVPSLVGQAERKIEIELQQDGLIPGDQARVPSRDAPAGTVLAQVPPPDSPAVPGTRVHRLVSSGPEAARWVMPDMTGRTLRAAEEWIELCGFRRGAVRRVEAAGRPSGTVLGQLPLAGYPIRDKDVVELTVAR